eukprot:gnl/TRDRNA2_/TRDRNA2_177179_c2_seq2.p2 gnl/TRDRNA2_/TRDRNA2_177179_c2~~gnl/TRDRNA2_/TRDRNA2_177179_c2_seq2.p2  ORF type:complete len:157 (+),score=14.70 gnl/TRDRNA2_/TRDRNA2_177179_c2_seq2:1220-1690(+)
MPFRAKTASSSGPSKVASRRRFAFSPISIIFLHNIVIGGRKVDDDTRQPIFSPTHVGTSRRILLDVRLLCENFIDTIITVLTQVRCNERANTQKSTSLPAIDRYGYDIKKRFAMQSSHLQLPRPRTAREQCSKEWTSFPPQIDESMLPPDPPISQM